ncbi:MAG: hypothetical protein KGP08_10565, partial [Xanthomonadaceae bacterium]|nr:hypothetical protein [Xanthomonadaceae bacterium]
QGADALARQQLAARDVFFTGLFAAAERGARQVFFQIVDYGAQACRVGDEFRRTGVNLRFDDGHYGVAAGKARMIGKNEIGRSRGRFVCSFFER